MTDAGDERVRLGAHPFCGRCTDETLPSAAPDTGWFNGFGSMFHGAADRCPACGSVVRTLAICLLWIPVWPMGRFRIIRLGGGRYVGRLIPFSADNPYGLGKKTAARMATLEAARRQTAEPWPEPPPSGLAQHPRLRGRRFRDAEDYWELGFPGNALEEYEKVLAAHEAVLAADDTATLQIRRRIGEAYLATGQMVAAVAMLEQTVAHLRRVLGPEHPDSKQSTDDVLNARSPLGTTRDQITALTQELAGLSRSLGRDHPHVLRTAGALGITHLAASRPLPAIEVLREALDRAEQALGTDHPDTRYLRGLLVDACVEGRLTGQLKEPQATELGRRLDR